MAKRVTGRSGICVIWLASALGICALLASDGCGGHSDKPAPLESVWATSYDYVQQTSRLQGIIPTDGNFSATNSFQFEGNFEFSGSDPARRLMFGKLRSPVVPNLFQIMIFGYDEHSTRLLNVQTLIGVPHQDFLILRVVPELNVVYAITTVTPLHDAYTNHILLFHYDRKGQLTPAPDLVSTLMADHAINGALKYEPSATTLYCDEEGFDDQGYHHFETFTTVQPDGTFGQFQTTSLVGPGPPLGYERDGASYTADGRFEIFYSHDRERFEVLQIFRGLEWHISQTDSFPQQQQWPLCKRTPIRRAAQVNLCHPSIRL